ncbi:MAG: hypothetical protein COV70_00495 [Parcubacteria group bacterium CG11_big_fil_rev_8_21_14_0_20_39_22]|nr:MAG: hypothetical protein COV70_00495 [Parcubacteria group bacterium CG11_big_fil_rev_8_21_14_0_20_39_22]
MEMESKFTLIVNTGSASKKYSLYNNDFEIARFYAERVGPTSYEVSFIDLKSDKSEKMPLLESTYDECVEFFVRILLQKGTISRKEDIKEVGIRVVAPTDAILETQLINEAYLKELQKVATYDILHTRPLLEEIYSLSKSFQNTHIYGVSDSAFHGSMSKVAKSYSLPQSRNFIRRFGYHGLSASSSLRIIEKSVGNIPPKIIICHLGSGSSITAIKDGKSIDTSMGFSPLEGVPMSSRIGNIGPGAVIALGKSKGFSYDELTAYLYKECGLKGLSGSIDMKNIIETSTKSESSKFALDFFVYSIKKYIGSYFAVLGGLDMLVFAGTIGERAAPVRSLVCNDLEHLGILIDENKNANVPQLPASIESQNSKVKIMTIEINEMKEIFHEIEKHKSQ